MAANIITIVVMLATATLAAIMTVDCVGAFQMTMNYQAFGTSRNNVATRISSFEPVSVPSIAPVRKLQLSATASSASDDADSHNAKNNRLEEKTWMFQNKYPIAYEVASHASSDIIDADNDDVEVVPILLLNGFGVGSFHQHSLMRQILLQHDEEDEEDEKKQKKQYVIYGIDYLGQGKSWPENCNDGNSNDELNLGYSADMWLDQLKGFIEEVILAPSSSSSSSSSSNTKVHLVGNSVGGYLSTILTNRHPHLISSLTLLNATPVWGLNLPGWDGKLPAPPLPKIVGRALFDTIRDVDIIDKYLEAAYVHRDAFDGTYDDSFDGCSDAGTADRQALGEKIRACTESEGGHAAFASILWSSPASEGTEEMGGSSSPPKPADFYGALEKIPVDVLLLFGADDPWCTPAVAKRMHTTLVGRDGMDAPAQRYIELGKVGHCPNHEAPTAVARVLLPWIAGTSSSSQRPTVDDDGQCRSKVPLVSGSGQIREPWGVVRLREVSVEESQNLGMMDRIVSNMVG